MSPVRSYVARYFTLELESLYAGYLKSLEGGDIKSEVVSQKIGGSVYTSKHIGIPSYEPFSCSVGMSMSESFWDWIEDAWNGKIVRKNGSVQALDHDLTIMQEQSFEGALVTETTIPALDGASKEPFYMSVKFQAERSKHIMSSGKKGKTVSKDEQKLWLPSNFRFEMDNMNCSRVNKVESFTVKQGVKRLEIGPLRTYELEPTSLEFPNIVISMSQSHAEDFYKWHEDFVIKGNNTTDKEKNGQITMLTKNRTKPLLEIDLYNMGIFKLSNDKGDSSTDTIRRVKVEMYCERMAFKWNG